MTCFMDVKGYLLTNTFVCKEVAIVCPHGRSFGVWTFRPPFSWDNLSAADRFRVKRTVEDGLTLPWNDGVIPYRCLESLFVTIAQKFKNWVVEDTLVKENIFPYKCTSVRIVTLEQHCEDVCGLYDRYLADDVTRPVITCFYDHPQCAARTATYLMNIFQRMQNHASSCE